MNRTILHVIASTRADHVGTSRSASALGEALDAGAVEVHLVTTDPNDPAPDQEPVLTSGNVYANGIGENTRLH